MAPNREVQLETSNGTQLLRTFGVEWAAKYGRTYIEFTAQDKKLAEDVAVQVTPKEWPVYIRTFLEDERDYYVRRRHPFRALADDFEQHAPPRHGRIMSEEEFDAYMADDRREEARLATLTPEEREAERNAFRRLWRVGVVAPYVESGRTLPPEYASRPEYRETYDELLAEHAKVHRAKDGGKWVPWQ